MRIETGLVGIAVVWLILSSAALNSQEKRVYDADAELVSFEDLQYPAIARVARVQGVVVIEAKLDDRGDVVDVSALSGSRALATDCLSNARKWKFKPNPRKTAIIVYEFTLDDGSCHDASHSLFLLRYQNFASIRACAPVIGG